MKTRPIERNMFFGAKSNIFLKASELRRNMSDAEKLLWKALSDRKVFDIRFRRQHPIDIFIVDFSCHRCKLAIEVDGEIHQKEEVKNYDTGRTSDIEKLGITLLRFTNNEIVENIENVMKTITNEINRVSPPLGGVGGE
jgi:very-short-patch-repair endonuclease